MELHRRRIMSAKLLGVVATAFLIAVAGCKSETKQVDAQAKDVLVHIHPPLVAIGAVAMQQYRLNEAVAYGADGSSHDL
jgi:hypothetical protein